MISPLDSPQQFEAKKNPLLLLNEWSHNHIISLPDICSSTCIFFLKNKLDIVVCRAEVLKHKAFEFVRKESK